MARHTRRNPSGPLLGTDALGKAEHMKRGAPAEARWQRAMKQTGVKEITERNLDRVLRVLEKPRAKKRGGRKSRHTRRR